MKLTSQLLVLRLRIHEYVFPLLHMPFWHAQWQHSYLNGWHTYHNRKYKSESNENIKYLFKYYLLCRSGTKLYHFSTISPTLNASPPALTKCINSFRKNSFGSPRNHSCTAWHTSSSKRNFFPPIASLSDPNIWKSLGPRSGQYGG